MTLAVDATPAVMQVENPARQEAFVRAELIRRLFEGSKQSRYFSFVLWPVIAAIYWRQVNLTELVPPFVAHLAVTVGFDVLRRNFARANPSDDEVVRWGWWFAGLSFLAGACWGVAGYMPPPHAPTRAQNAIVISRRSRCCADRRMGILAGGRQI